LAGFGCSSLSTVLMDIVVILAIVAEPDHFTRIF
jgi:hypothetical protein